MKLTDVTPDDGRNCAHLINFLKAGRWELSGEDAGRLVQVKSWIASMAGQMAENLKSPAPTSNPTEGFKITKMGPLSSSSKKGKRK